MEKGFMLIVDHIENNRKNLFQIFSDEFYILEADNYIDALKVMKMHVHHLSVVLLDISMIKMNGFDVLKEINKEDALKNIPIIAITEEASSECGLISAGLSDFIEKPFDPDIIKAKVKSFFKVKSRETVNNESDQKFSVLKCFTDMKIPYLIIKLDEHNNPLIYYVNNIFRNTFKSWTNSIIGKSCDEMFPDYLDIIKICKNVAINNQNDNTEYIEVSVASGSYYSVNLYAPRPGYCICLIQDISFRKKFEQHNIEAIERENRLLTEKAQEQEKYKIIAVQTGAVVFEWNSASNRMKFLDNVNEFMFSNKLDDDLTLDVSEVTSSEVYFLDLNRLLETINTAVNNLDDSFEFILRVINKKGKFIWCRISANFFYENKDLVRAIGTIKDINNEIDNLKQLEYAAKYDYVSGIYNKRYFLDLVGKSLNNNPDIQFSLVLLNVDNFKMVNNLFGHDKGDELLFYIGSKIKQFVAEYQVSSYGRLESDEFCVFIPRKFTIDFTEKLKTINLEGGMNYEVTISMGIYDIIDTSLSIDIMCDRARIALNTVKGNYLKKYAFFDESLYKSVVREQEIVSGMNTALIERQFVVYYQPRYHLNSKIICGAEALVRWIHPRKGMILPDEFIPVFEKNGFIMKLDQYVWEEACAFIRKQIDEGRTPIPISVNVSKVNAYNLKLCDIFISLVTKYNIPPELLQLELTESTYIDKTNFVNNIMKILQNYGFKILMDDFGSGYSSLNVLKDIHVDVLKIDVDFLVNKNDSDRGGLILSSVIRMAKWLNLHTVMEGVETREQVTFLKSIGCEEAQGFLFAKPMTGYELEKLLKNQHTTTINYTDICIEDIKELWDPDSKLCVLFNNMLSPAGIYEVRDDYIEALRLNDQYCESIDLCRDSISGCTYNINDYILEEDRKILWSMLNNAKKSNEICEGIVRRYVANNEIKTFNMKIKHITGNVSSSMFFVVLSEVIYEQK